MESKRLNMSRMKCCRIPAEKGCFIFSIINAVLVSTCLVACICYAGWVINFHVHQNNEDGLELALNIILCIILSVCTSVAFIFAVVLCYGARQKRPAFLMAYFVYGILVEIASVGGAIYFLVNTFNHDEPGGVALGFVALTGCVVYAFPLSLVYRAYVVLADNAVLPSGHAKLPNIYPVL